MKILPLQQTSDVTHQILSAVKEVSCSKFSVLHLKFCCKIRFVSFNETPERKVFIKFFQGKQRVDQKAFSKLDFVMQ